MTKSSPSYFRSRKTRLLAAALSASIPLAALGDAAAQNAPAAPKAGATAEAKDLVATLNAAGQFGTFCKLLLAAGLQEALQAAGPFTVFAPTDEAFAKLPVNVIDDLLKPENKEKLTQLISYHIANGKNTLADLSQKESLMTWAGEELEVDQGSDGKTVQIDDAQIKTADLTATNGVLHVLDSVLQP